MEYQGEATRSVEHCATYDQVLQLSAGIGPHVGRTGVIAIVDAQPVKWVRAIGVQVENEPSEIDHVARYIGADGESEVLVIAVLSVRTAGILDHTRTARS